MAILRPKHLSKAGAAFIGAFEGLRLTPYNDAAGHATVGYGHLLHYGPVTQHDLDKYRGFTTGEAVALLQTVGGRILDHEVSRDEPSGCEPVERGSSPRRPFVVHSVHG